MPGFIKLFEQVDMISAPFMLYNLPLHDLSVLVAEKVILHCWRMIWGIGVKINFHGFNLNLVNTSNPSLILYRSSSMVFSLDLRTLSLTT